MDSAGGESPEIAKTAADGLPERVADLVGDVTQEEQPRRGRRLTALLAETARDSARAMGRGARATQRGARWGTRWLAEQVLATAPRLPVRDQETLRAQFPGLSPEEVADTLIEGAARASGAVGAAVGVWSVLPVVPAFPVEAVTETLALVGIEIKLIAELHEVFGMRAPGKVTDRMTAYVEAWARRGGVGLAPGGLVLAIGSPLRRRLQRRLVARAGKSAVSLGPLLTGAEEVRDDLRQRSPIAAHWPS